MGIGTGRPSPNGAAPNLIAPTAMAREGQPTAVSKSRLHWSLRRPLSSCAMRVLVVDELSSSNRPGVTLEPVSGGEVGVRFASLAEAPGALGGVDVAVIDVALLEREGLDALQKLLAANPQTGVLVVAFSDS